MQLPAPSSPPLYKYAKWVHADALLRWGQVRVGTLFDYQRAERHARGVGDEAEGTKALNEIIDEANHLTLSEFARAQIGVFFGGGGPGYIANTEVRAVYRSSNRWLYCTSQTLSYRVMDSFEAGYDACVTITHPTEFYQTIGTELGRLELIGTGGMYPVTYRTRLQDYRADDGRPGWLIKSPEYAAQTEVRFVYVPTAEAPITSTYVDLTLPLLKAFCEPARNIPG
jgi:hypothetical protein